MNMQLFFEGQPKTVLYHLCGGSAEESKTVFASLQAEHTGFACVSLLVEDWNSSLSPWAAPPVFGQEGFAGRGRDTLRCLTEEILPFVEEKLGKNVESYIGGYSLAGLFSLWAFYETGLFRGAASCSGSLWFPGWAEYAKTHSAAKDSLIYLSLGDKEEKTRNPQLQKVGEETRQQYKRIMEDTGVSASCLEWNPGGHFHQPMERTVRGFAWLLENRS